MVFAKAIVSRVPRLKYKQIKSLDKKVMSMILRQETRTRCLGLKLVSVHVSEFKAVQEWQCSLPGDFCINPGALVRF